MTLDPIVVFGAIGTILASVLASGMAGKWVFGWTYDRKSAESDFWRDKFLTSMATTEDAITVAKKAARG